MDSAEIPCFACCIGSIQVSLYLYMHAEIIKMHDPVPKIRTNHHCDQTKSCFSPPKMYKIFGVLFFFHKNLISYAKPVFVLLGKNQNFCKYQEHNSTYSSRKKIKIGRLPDDEAKEKKQVKFHAGEVCYLRPMWLLLPWNIEPLHNDSSGKELLCVWQCFFTGQTSPRARSVTV